MRGPPGVPSPRRWPTPSMAPTPTTGRWRSERFGPASRHTRAAGSGAPSLVTSSSTSLRRTSSGARKARSCIGRVPRAVPGPVVGRSTAPRPRSAGPARAEWSAVAPHRPGRSRAPTTVGSTTGPVPTCGRRMSGAACVCGSAGPKRSWLKPRSDMACAGPSAAASPSCVSRPSARRWPTTSRNWPSTSAGGRRSPLWHSRCLSTALSAAPVSLSMRAASDELLDIGEFGNRPPG